MHKNKMMFLAVVFRIKPSSVLTQRLQDGLDSFVLERTEKYLIQIYSSGVEQCATHELLILIIIDEHMGSAIRILETMLVTVVLKEFSKDASPSLDW
jgi:hypothetical protein